MSLEVGFRPDVRRRYRPYVRPTSYEDLTETLLDVGRCSRSHGEEESEVHPFSCRVEDDGLELKKCLCSFVLV